MKTRPGIGSDRDAIVAQLAQLDSSDPADPARSPEPPSTVRELKAELDTLIGELREPAGSDPFADETGLRRAQELVRAIGVEPESKVRDQRLELGRIGPYELLEKLGEGGMGAVYKALHSSLEKIVALKVLPRERLHPQAISRFKREMKAVGKLDHPNIVRATDAGEADGDHFLVMEYVDGVDLSELLRRVGPLAPADACELVWQAANGLQHAHQRRMVHRDIKPNNIMLSWGDEHEPAVKILDMGLALLSEPVPAAQRDLTTTGQMMGTVEYMSPEQGMDTHNVDIRSDIYSLGATLYKLLCGKAPFTGNRYNTPGKILVALATEKPASIGTLRADLPAGLVAVVDRMLAKDAAERYATPAEVAKALAPFASGADLRRLANAARHGISASDAADKSGMPTEEHLSSPITGTVSEIESAREGEFREGEAPAEPRASDHYGSAGASPSHASPSHASPSHASPSHASPSHASPSHASPSHTSPTRISPSLAASRHRVAVVAAIGLLLAGLGAILFGGQIIRIVTNQGQIVIETDGAGIEVVIKDGQGKVLDTETKREITFDAGEYDIEVTVKDSAGEQRFVTDHFVLTRNGRKVVDARWESAKPKPTAASSDPDRRAAEWVLSVGGAVGILVGGESRVVLATASQKLPNEDFTLESVDLYRLHGMVTDADVKRLSGVQSLSEIGLDETSAATDAAVEQFAEFPNLVKLHLWRNPGITGTCLGHLKKFQNLTLAYLPNLDSDLQGLKGASLRHLHIVACPKITDAMLVSLQSMPELRSLALESIKLTDSGWVHLGQLTKLTNLSIVHTDVTDQQLNHLGHMTDLRELDLVNTQVTDAGIEELARIRGLTRLNLTKSKVTKDGVQKLVSALPQCIITSDHGTFEPMTDPDRRAAEWVLSIGGRIWINGEENREITAMAALPHERFRLTGFTLSGIKQVTDSGLAHFDGCTNLTVLDLNVTETSDMGLANFKHCKQLAVLYLRDTKLTDSGLIQFKDCNDLRHVYLARTQVTDAGMKFFENCKDLLVLELDGTRVTDVGLAHFKNSALQHLFLNNTQVTDAGLAHFRDRISMFNLQLAGTKVTDAGLAHLKDYNNLATLDLGNTGVSDAGLANFRDCKNLNALTLQSTDISDAGLEHIASHSKLSFLDLKNTKVTEAGVKKLSAALPKCKIEWDGGVIEPTAAADPDRGAAEWVLSVGGSISIKENGQERRTGAVGDLPQGAFELTSVDLHSNPNVSDANLAVFKDCKDLRGLFLHDTQVGDSGLAHFKNCKNLTHLALSDTKVSAVGLAHFQQCKNLGVLILENTQVSDAGLAHFKDCKQLTTLNVVGTQISDAGLAHFKDCQYLTYLYLVNSSVSDAGLVQFAGMKQLISLTLQKTKVTEAGVKTLSAALPGCKIEWDGGVIEPTASADPDRRVAEWVLRVGGSLSIAFNGRFHTPLTRVAELPAGPFKVVSIRLHSPAKVDDVALENLQGLTDLVGHLELPNQPITDAGVERLTSMPGLANLSSLDLCGTRITDVGVAHLKRFKKLSYPRLTNTQVTDEGLKHIGDMPLVNQLLIGHTAITDAGLAHLRGLKLNVLHIYQCRGITGPGLEHLRNMSSLTLLHLQQTPVGADAVKKLAAALPQCTVLWDGGVIEPSSVLAPVPLTAEQRRALEWLLTHHGNATCRSENQYLWKLTPSTLPKGPAEFVNLTLEQFSLTEESHRQLLALPNFGQGFGVGHSPNIHDAELARLLELPNLRGITEVSLYDVGITDASLPLLKRFRLNLLVLGAIPITDRGFQEVAELPLTRLELLECPQLTGKSFQSIGRIRTLTELHLQKFAFKDAELAFLTSLDRLKALSVTNTPITDAGLEHLAKLPAIEVLSVTQTKVTEAGVKKLSAALPQCKIEWDGGVIEPTVAADPDRRAADWVLSIGGSISIMENGQERQIEAPGDLPRRAIQLTYVVLNNNQKVTDAGLAQFKDCKNLTSLKLVGTQVSDAGLTYFKDCKNLTQLVLAGTKVGDAGLAQFKDCKNLASLNLAGTQVSDAGLAQFKDCKNLTQLDLTNTQVSDVGLAVFKDCKNLGQLGLGGTKVSDAGLAYFEDCKNLEQLSLSVTKVSDAGLAVFKDCKNLTALALIDTALSDAGLSHFAGCPKLGFVFVTKTKVTEAGVKKLSAALPGCKIEWDGGVIEPTVAVGPDRRAAEWVLAARGKVDVFVPGRNVISTVTRSVDLPSEPFTVRVIEANPSGPPNLVLKDDDVQVLEPLTELERLNVYEGELTNQGLERLSHCRFASRIGFLRLGGRNKISDRGLAHLPLFMNVGHLSIDSDEITGNGLKSLHSLPKLSALRINSKNLTDLEPLRGLQLAWLEIVGEMVTSDWLLFLSENKALRSLSVPHTSIDDRLFDLVDLSALDRLIVGSSRVTDVGVTRIARLPHLRVLHLDHLAVTDACLLELAKSSSLESLQVGETKVTAAGVKKLHAALPGCKIEWDGGVIEPTAAADPDRRAAEWVLSKGGSVRVTVRGEQSGLIKTQTELPQTAFELTEVLLNDRNVSDLELQSLQGLNNLVTLEIGLSGTADDGLAHLKDLRSLKFLGLLGTKITDEGLRHISRFTGLQGLNLIGTRVTDAGLEHLKKLSNLSSLRLEETRVTVAGIAALQSALPKCQIEWDAMP